MEFKRRWTREGLPTPRSCCLPSARRESLPRRVSAWASQGHAVSKDTVHALLGHLVDAFLLTLVPLATDSERRRNANPRKVYPVDPGLARAFDPSGRANLGRALETAVLNALARQGAEVGYVRTEEGFEVDFLARIPGEPERLIQVCADPNMPEVLERERRALDAAARTHPRAERVLIVLTREQAARLPGQGIRMYAAYEWLLEEGREVFGQI